MTRVQSQSRAAIVALVVAMAAPIVLSAQQGVTHYVRYQRGSTIAYGIKEGDTVRELQGDLFTAKPTNRTYKLSEVKLLMPIDPKRVGKILGVAVNSGAPGKTVPKDHPTLFTKFPEQLVGDGSEVPLFPETLGGMIYEAELVIVMGKKARYVSVADAPKYIFGVAIGHDLNNLGWWMQNGAGGKLPERFLAKNQDAAAGIGTEIVSGLNHNDLAITVKRNDKTVNVQRTSQYNNTPEQIISYVSRYMDLNPGDLIYMACLCTGRDLTHRNQQLHPGDKYEFILENGGRLRQTMVAAKIPPGATTWPDREPMSYKSEINLKPLSTDGTDMTPGAER
jgi:2-keto-4-pentenoate hydratase/2-oxohepta-3-ene-1,7-dioic acid hydratase in catechol pathway